MEKAIDPISDIVERMKRKILKHHRVASNIREWWLKELGDVAEHTHLVGIRHGILFVEVDNSPLIFEMSFRSRELAMKMNLRAVRFRLRG
jgi:hypothetical protein